MDENINYNINSITLILTSRQSTTYNLLLNQKTSHEGKVPTETTISRANEL